MYENEWMPKYITWMSLTNTVGRVICIIRSVWYHFHTVWKDAKNKEHNYMFESQWSTADKNTESGSDTSFLETSMTLAIARFLCASRSPFIMRILLPPTSKDCGEGCKSWQMWRAWHRASDCGLSVVTILLHRSTHNVSSESSLRVWQDVRTE